MFEKAKSYHIQNDFIFISDLSKIEMDSNWSENHISKWSKCWAISKFSDDDDDARIL